MENKSCAATFCDRDAFSLGWCKAHYQQQYLGRPITPIKPKRRLKTTAEGRICTACDEFKSWDAFYQRTNRGYQSICKVCMSAQNREDTLARISKGIPCVESACDDPAETKGLCSRHYRYQWFKNKAAQ